MKEANIIKKFRDKLPGHWTSIENSVTSGVPDYVASRSGQLCWIEFKRLYNCDIIVRPLQRNWMIREVRHNPNVWVAWWDDGPVIIRADLLLKLNGVEKNGKIYYDVVDNATCVTGWDNVDKHLFGDQLV
jgi:hypothetical protein